MTISGIVFSIVCLAIVAILLFGFVQNLREREVEQATLYGAIIAFIVSLWAVLFIG